MFILYLIYSYKFHRLFPLSQYDLPTHNANILSFPRPAHRPSLGGTARPSAVNVIVRPPPPTPLAGSPLQSMRRVPRSVGGVHPQLTMTPEQISRNPEVDYTRYVWLTRTNAEISEALHTLLTSYTVPSTSASFFQTLASSLLKVWLLVIFDTADRS